MEMNILIESGDRNGAKSIAEVLAMQLSRRPSYTVVRAAHAMETTGLVYMGEPEDGVVLFDEIRTPQALLACVAALTKFRNDNTHTTIAAVFLCDPSVIVLSSSEPLHIERGRISPSQLEDLKEAFDNMPEAQELKFLSRDVATVQEMPADGRPPLGPALVWDNALECYQKPTLELEGAVVCEARNVMIHLPKYGAPITFEEHTRERRMNGFVTALPDQTDAFFKGTAEQVRFKAERVRPANVTEVLRYLQLKYGYQLIKAQNNDKDSN